MIDRAYELALLRELRVMAQCLPRDPRPVVAVKVERVHPCVLRVAR